MSTDNTKKELTTEEKLTAVQMLPEIENAIKILFAVFNDCELKTHIKMVWDIDQKNYAIMFCTEEHYKQTALMAEELERVKAAISKLLETSNDLMNHCIDHGFIDPEDETDGYKEFQEATSEAIKSLNTYNNESNNNG